MKTVQHILDTKGHDICTIHPDASVYDAIQEMADKDIGALVVLEDGKLMGLLSERDYARNVILRGKSSPKTPVRDIMKTHVVCARPDQTVEQCMAVMAEKRVRHLPVLDKKHLIGLISIGDVVNSIIEDQQFAIDELYHYIHTA